MTVLHARLERPGAFLYIQISNVDGCAGSVVVGGWVGG
jgi:hypothetical protein